MHDQFIVKEVKQLNRIFLELSETIIFLYLFMQKEQASVSVSNISDDPSLVLKRWRGPKAHNNRYEPWEKENQSTQNKQEDKWEFPRHRLKVGNYNNLETIRFETNMAII